MKYVLSYRKRRSLQIPPLANLTSVLNKEEIGLLKKETEVEKPKKSQPGRTSSQNGTEEPETDPDKPPDPEFEVEHIVNYQFCKITVSTHTLKARFSGKIGRSTFFRNIEVFR